MRGAAIAEEAALVSVRVEAKILEASDSRARGAFGDIGVEVEHRAPFSAAWTEVARRVVARAFEGGYEFGANLVGLGPNARAEPGDNVAALRAKPLHRCHRRFDHPLQRPFPARMRRSDHARALVSKQDHAAVS